jgi:hypothetical protein
VQRCSLVGHIEVPPLRSAGMLGSSLSLLRLIAADDHPQRLSRERSVLDNAKLTSGG